MHRREFVLGLTAAAMCSHSARSQTDLPKIGFLSRGDERHLFRFRDAYLAGLSDAGFKDGLNVHIIYRWANGSSKALNSLARGLVEENVDVILATGGGQTPFVAKEATSKIPIVFVTGSDPIAVGLVRDLSRPEANLTGITFFGVNLVAKRVQLLKEMVPKAQRFVLLVGINPNETEVAIKSSQEVSKILALKTEVFHIRTSQDIDRVMKTTKKQGFDGIVYGSDPVFGAYSEHIAKMAVLNGIPAIGQREIDVKAGGLATYGTNIPTAYKEAGRYTARILRGAKPGNLPILHSKFFDLSINLSAAKRLRLTIPSSVLASATFVIE